MEKEGNKPETGLRREDYRGLIALTLIVLFAALSVIELLAYGRLEASDKLLPMVALIVGFYFGSRRVG
ncbi:hypothetical protein DRO57_08715 [Candidatus Bathyarchaeota archaeon]|nr:MAG: hypothetical protein DRO57_08715 [Candidatus Bathyarchaeota archaeon]